MSDPEGEPMLHDCKSLLRETRQQISIEPTSPPAAAAAQRLAAPGYFNGSDAERAKLAREVARAYLAQQAEIATLQDREDRAVSEFNRMLYEKNLANAARDRAVASLEREIEAQCEDDTEIRELCRPILGDVVDGDPPGYQLPLAEVVRRTIAAIRNTN